MAINELKREQSDLGRALGDDSDLSEKIAESKKSTMQMLEQITRVPDEDDMQALEQARAAVKSEAKGDFESRVDTALEAHEQRSRELQDQSRESAEQVSENANVIQSAMSSADYGKSSMGSTIEKLNARNRDYTELAGRLAQDIDEARHLIEARKRELDS